MICLKTQLYGFRGPLPTPTPSPTGLKTSQQLELGDRPSYLPKEKIIEKNSPKDKIMQPIISLCPVLGKGFLVQLSQGWLFQNLTFPKGLPCALI